MTNIETKVATSIYVKLLDIHTKGYSSISFKLIVSAMFGAASTTDNEDRYF